MEAWFRVAPLLSDAMFPVPFFMNFKEIVLFFPVFIHNFYRL
jgi:hypothetical protein